MGFLGRKIYIQIKDKFPLPCLSFKHNHENIQEACMGKSNSKLIYQNTGAHYLVRKVSHDIEFYAICFRFEVDAYLPFEGFSKATLKECTLQNQNPGSPCFTSLLTALQKIWESVSRVIIFNGNQYAQACVGFIYLFLLHYAHLRTFELIRLSSKHCLAFWKFLY